MKLSVKTLKWVLEMIEAELVNCNPCGCVRKKLLQIKSVLKMYIKDPKD